MNKTAEILAERLSNQRLSFTEFEQPADVVRWMGAVQAQEFHAAKWALALRMRDATSAGIQEAFDRGEILRTHVMRPTWHFVTPEDIRWLLQLTAPRVNVASGSGYRRFEIDDAVCKKTRRVFTKVLQGGKQLTRAELKAALNGAGIDANNSIRMGHILLRAELDGLICSGPVRGKQFTYALFEERVPAAERIDPDEALVRLTLRYFRSHGPASLHDFVWWSGLTTADARRGLALAEGELRKVDVYWSAANPSNFSISKARANFLPQYDEYNVAYKHRALVVPPGTTTWNQLGPGVIVDGIIVGTWTSRLDHEFVLIEVTPSQPLKQTERRAIANAADRYGAYFELPARVAYGLK